MMLMGLGTVKVRYSVCYPAVGREIHFRRQGEKVWAGHALRTKIEQISAEFRYMMLLDSGCLNLGRIQLEPQ